MKHGLRPVAQPQPLVNIIQADTYTEALRIGVGSKKVKILRKTAAVITYLHRKQRLLTLYRNIDASMKAAVFQSMKQTVFYQRLN